ncbi:MAG: 16S rRNA (cytidine(1402)-2'-O)-methyltransferase [bacterium]|nr:MAG: 16S rRNA (cytidine(1402)-2'-O)-methyltransferase [bacterium]
MRSFRFYLVSTPIGNLGDISSRAVDVLSSVDLVLAEDTRKARILLTHYGVKTPVRSYHDHNKERITPSLIRQMRSGKTIALIADAGTPTVSDPGYYIIRKLIEEGIEFTAIPGPSAVLQALVLSGLPPDRFTFFGYVPRSAGARRRVIMEAAEGIGTAVFFESPRRLRKTLAEIAGLLEDREVVVARELTKIHEEIVRGSASVLLEHFTANVPKGEITLLIRGTGKRKRAGTA